MGQEKVHWNHNQWDQVVFCNVVWLEKDIKSLRLVNLGMKNPHHQLVFLSCFEWRNSSRVLFLEPVLQVPP